MNIAICVQQHHEILEKKFNRKYKLKNTFHIFMEMQQLNSLIQQDEIDLVIVDQQCKFLKQAKKLCKQFQIDFTVIKKCKPLRKRIRQFFINEQGSVSIYLIIVVIALFFFNAVLIDYARILVAENQTESAAKAAVRSTMASFDPRIHEYGLFGLNDPKPTSTFQGAFAKNLSLQQGGYFHFTDTQMVKGQTEVSINEGKMLSNPSAFKHQIVENMKYRARIQFTKAIIDGLMKVSDSMEQASAFAELASDIDKKAKVRKKKLDQAKSDLSKAKSTLENMEQTIREESKQDFPSVKIMEDIVDNEDTYKQVLSSKDSGGSPQKYSKADTKSFERDSKSLINQIVSKSKSVKTNLENAVSEINKARQENQLIKKAIEEKRKQKNNDYETTTKYEKKYGKQTNSLNGVKSNLEKANKKLDDYVMDDSYFTTSVKKINHALKEVGGSFIVELVKFNNIVQNDLDTADRHYMDKKQIGIESRHKTSLKDVNQAYSFFTENRKSYQSKSKKEQQDDAKNSLEKNKEQLNQLMDQAEGIAGDSQVYKILRKLVDKYNGAASSQPGNVNMEDPRQTSDDSMALMDQLFHQLGAALKSERNQIYINEYILTRFKSHDFSLKGAEAYNFENNQVEYIIYGIPEPGANYAAAMSEIFAIRFAINFLQAFSDPSVDATGPLVFWTALSKALLLTLGDIERISNGNKILFFKNFRYYTGYSDYLRMILFLHVRGKQLARSMAIINYKTNKDLTKSPTYIEGEATTRVRLWFIPELSKLLVNRGEYVKGNNVFISRKESYSY